MGYSQETSYSNLAPFYSLFSRISPSFLYGLKKFLKIEKLENGLAESEFWLGLLEYEVQKYFINQIFKKKWHPQSTWWKSNDVLQGQKDACVKSKTPVEGLKLTFCPKYSTTHLQLCIIENHEVLSTRNLVLLPITEYWEILLFWRYPHGSTYMLEDQVDVHSWYFRGCKRPKKKFRGSAKCARKMVEEAAPSNGWYCLLPFRSW